MKKRHRGPIPATPGQPLTRVLPVAVSAADREIVGLLVELGDFASGAHDIAHAASHPLTGIPAAVAKRIAKALSAHVDGKVAKHIAKLLTSDDPADINKAVEVNQQKQDPIRCHPEYWERRNARRELGWICPGPGSREELAAMAENGGPVQPRRRGPGRQWKPGQSGNPKGKPIGTRHKATMAAEALLDGEAEALTRKAVDMAKAGDPVALRLCLERIIPARKSRPITIALPPLTSAADATAAMATVTAAVAGGELSPDEGVDMNTIIAGYAEALEISDIEARLRKLEEQTK
jgi:hypothetical protein